MAGVTAVDADTGDNGQILYSLVDAGVSGDFQIHAHTGVITTKKTLSQGAKRFHVRATDKVRRER